MRSFLLSPIFLLALLSWGCSKKPAVVTGQIFVVTKGGENIKMGAVPVRIIPEEQFKEIALKTLPEIENQVRIETGNWAAKRMRDGLLAEINAMKSDDLSVPGLDQLRKEVESEDGLQELKNQPGLQTMAMEAFARALPPATAKTDADGRFTAEIASKIWLVAAGRRSVGGNEEEYLWLLPHQASKEALPQPVLISNDSDVDSKEELYALLAPLVGKEGGLTAYEIREPSAEVVKWVGGIKERASKMIAEAKANAEAERQKHDANLFVNILKMKFVRLPELQVLMCIHETRNVDYAAYAGEQSGVDNEWQSEAGPGKEQHPVVNVSYEDAEGFCRWLSAKEGKLYRLPTDAEWSVAVGLFKEAGRMPIEKDKNTTREYFPWGESYPPDPKDGNYGLIKVDDGYPGTAPVMSFRMNKLGIYDLGGNVWEWCQDLYDEKQEGRVLRGGAWVSLDRNTLLSSRRFRQQPNVRSQICGFRLVLALSSAQMPGK